MEIDEGLAELARERIRAAGADVTAVAGDGAGGRPVDALYDWVIAAYGVGPVSWAWIHGAVGVLPGRCPR
ncbi:hypothetical protein [Streptomyces sp. NPDC091278]|uniref:hypothetical protein n=1 Tax=Streptomyces sp. NPDC091278 TaxID=3155301 RepID=UPI00344C20B9